MIGNRIALMLPWLAMICLISSGGGSLRAEGVVHSPATVQEAESLQLQEAEPIEYVAENGRKIAITLMGNLGRIEGPAGFPHMGLREGYIVAYNNIVAFDVRNRRSSTIKPGLPDFVPVSFKGPSPKTILRRGQLLNVIVVVRTRDNRLELTQDFSMIGGTSDVRLITTVKNVSKNTIILRSFKRQTDIDVDTGGAYGILDSRGDVFSVQPPATLLPPSCPDVPSPPPIAVLPPIHFGAGPCCEPGCQCPPELRNPIDEESANLHAVVVRGGPDFADDFTPQPSYSNVSLAGNNSEFKPGAGLSLQLPRRGENNQVTLGWLLQGKLRRLAPNGSVRFVELLDVS